VFIENFKIFFFENGKKCSVEKTKCICKSLAILYISENYPNSKIAETISFEKIVLYFYYDLIYIAMILLNPKKPFFYIA
jgi:hypothetical protein